MNATAEIKYIRISYRKMRDLARPIRGMKAKTAITRLSFTPTKGARALKMAMESALSNAVNNHKMVEEQLIVERIEILKGPFFKRWNPVSRGMAHEIKKRMTHVKIVLTDNKSQNAKGKNQNEEKKSQVEEVKKEDLKEVKEVKKVEAKPKKAKEVAQKS